MRQSRELTSESPGRGAISRCWRAAVLLSLLAAALTSSANAASVVPNPGFDVQGTTNTGAADWFNGFVNSDAERDTSIFVSSPASLKITAANAGRAAYAYSSCMNGVTAGDYTVGVSYRTTTVPRFQLNVDLFTLSDCQDPFGIALEKLFPFPASSGGWFQASASFHVDAPNASAFVSVIIWCKADDVTFCDGGENANFDDVVLEPQTAVAAVFRSITATSSRRELRLRWRTASEIGVVGFNVYADVPGERRRLNTGLIRAKRATGAAYSFRFRFSALRTMPRRFWLQTVNLDGTGRWYGPVTAARLLTSPSAGSPARSARNGAR